MNSFESMGLYAGRVLDAVRLNEIYSSALQLTAGARYKLNYIQSGGRKGKEKGKTGTLESK